MAGRSRWLPIAREEKEEILCTNILPMALDGVETVHVNQAALSSLPSAITRDIGQGSTKRNVDLTLQIIKTL